MKLQHVALLAALVLAATGIYTAIAPARISASQDATAPAAIYAAKVQPILAANCYKCHGGFNHRGGLTLDTKAGLLKGGHTGPAIVPGDPAKSLLVQLIRHEGPADDPRPMPPKSKLSDDDIATVSQWIKSGALIPEDSPKP